MNENTIHLQENGSIIIRDAQSGNISIDTNDPGDSLQKLQGLNPTQIAIIKKLAEEHAAQLNATFRTLLSGVMSQKNIVHGGISNVKTVKIGDEIHYHYHGEKPALPKELTAKIPRTPPDKIIGREAELADLQRRLFHNKQVVLVNGLGGIGKTTLAQVYAAKYWEEYRHIAWVTQVSEDISSDFITSEGLLEILNIQSDGKEPKELFINIITELKKIAGEPNLLILDNVDSSLNQWYDYLPGQPRWHILATSRQRIEKFDVKELDFLTEAEAVALFLSHYTRGDISEDEIKGLVRAVDLHTLTIEILAKTADLQRSEPGALKNAIAADLKANVYVPHKGGKIEKVTSYLCSIFSMSGIRESELWLLKQFACLPPEFHGYQLLKDLINPAAAQKEDIFSETLEELSAAGWLLKNPESDSYKMHRIIGDVLKKQRPPAPADVEALLESVAAILYIDQAKDNPVDKFPYIYFTRH